MAQRKLSSLAVLRSLAGLDAAGCCNALCAHTTINIGCVRAPVLVAHGPHNAKLTRARVHTRVYQRSTRRNKQLRARKLEAQSRMTDKVTERGRRSCIEAVAVSDCSTLSIVKKKRTHQNYSSEEFDSFVLINVAAPKRPSTSTPEVEYFNAAGHCVVRDHR